MPLLTVEDYVCRVRISSRPSEPATDKGCPTIRRSLSDVNDDVVDDDDDDDDDVATHFHC